MYDVGKAVGQALVDLGISSSNEPTTFTEEELDKYFGVGICILRWSPGSIDLLQGSDYLGSNSRCRGIRSRAIGWKPTKTTVDMLASIKPEAEVLLKKKPAPL